MWFAFNLLSLTYWKQHKFDTVSRLAVVICFQSIIFDILKTTLETASLIQSSCDLLSIYYLWHTENNKIVYLQKKRLLWFAFNLLSLTYWKQPIVHYDNLPHVVICFQSIIFDILKTTRQRYGLYRHLLWFAFNLLSLTYWKQRKPVN